MQKKNNYFKGVLFAQVQQFGADNRYSLEILNQSGKKGLTKKEKVFGANAYVWRSYREKTDLEAFLPSLNPE